MSDKVEALRKAREERSRQKRRAVENAIEELKNNAQAITFSNVAAMSSVSRQYLYKNFKSQINALREDSRDQADIVDGVKVPNRTANEYKHVEALLRNKLQRTKDELTKARRESATLKLALEKERGRSEHWRKVWIGSRNNS